MEKLLKHKDLENQLADAKFQQSELKFKSLQERCAKEKEIVSYMPLPVLLVGPADLALLVAKALAHIEELVQKCKIQEESEKQLRAQLAVYTDKYQEFQTTLSKSNQVFETFKSEMDKVSGPAKVKQYKMTFTDQPRSV